MSKPVRLSDKEWGNNVVPNVRLKGLAGHYALWLRIRIEANKYDGLFCFDTFEEYMVEMEVRKLFAIDVSALVAAK